MLSTTNIAQRVEELDWSRIYRDLNERGYALTRRILSEEECEELKVSRPREQVGRRRGQVQ